MMKILIRSAEKDKAILFPTGLFLNRITAGVVVKWLRDNGIKMKRAQIVRLFKVLKRFKRNRRDWKLVEVQAFNGTNIEIII